MRFNFSTKLFASYIISFGFCTNIIAAEINVPDNFTTIQSAIDNASSGDIILVGPGTYIENLNYNGKSVFVRSTAGAESTILAPAGGRGVAMGPGGEFSGFTITGASSSFGAAMSVSGAGSIIRRNIFNGNAQSAGGYGAAIGGNNASSLIEQNIFKYNTCDSQGLSGVVTFINGSQPVIQNNVFHDNPCRAINMTLPSSGLPVVLNNTILRNTVGIKIDRRIDTGQQIYRNNIIYDNGTGLEITYGTESNNPTFENNLVYGNGVDYQLITDQTGVNGNISADPQFIDELSNNYHLADTSPAIDQGSANGAPGSDFEGNLRPADGDGNGSAIEDIGAYEHAEPLINVAIVGGSRSLECVSASGTQVVLQTSVNNNDDSFWFVNGNLEASGDIADIILQKGDNSVVLQNSNQIELDSVVISVVDSTPPQINAHFINTKTGAIATSVRDNSRQYLEVRISVSDMCDSNPSHNATVGMPAYEGQIIDVNTRRNRISPLGNEVSILVTATDADGNISEGGTTIPVN